MSVQIQYRQYIHLLCSILYLYSVVIDHIRTHCRRVPTRRSLEKPMLTKWSWHTIPQKLGKDKDLAVSISHRHELDSLSRRVVPCNAEFSCILADFKQWLQGARSVPIYTQILHLIMESGSSSIGRSKIKPETNCSKELPDPWTYPKAARPLSNDLFTNPIYKVWESSMLGQIVRTLGQVITCQGYFIHTL